VSRDDQTFHAVSDDRVADGLSPTTVAFYDHDQGTRIYGRKVPRKECISRKKFIRLAAAVGLGSAVVPLVGACGSDGGSAGSGETPTASGAAGGGGPKVRKGEAIAKESEVGSGIAFPFTDAETGQESVLVHLENGEFAAYSAICTHQACTVAYQPQTQKLACPCHGSVFDPADGARPTTGPAQLPLPEVAVRVEGGEVVRI
jgi:Rieske Fe-S protein